MKRRMTKILAGVLALGMLAGSGAWETQAASSYEINRENFSQDSLYYAAESADANYDGVLTKKEAAAVEELRIGSDMKDLTKCFKVFPNVTTLYLTADGNKSIKINNKKVKEIQVYGNYIVALKGAAPKTVRVSVDKASGTLDFSKTEGYSKVSAFYVSAPKATRIIAPNASKLEKVGITYCSKIKKIDTAAYKNVKELTLDGNNLKSIDVKKNTKLTSLACYDNKLTTLNISANTNLKDVGVGGNKLKTIDVTKNKKMNRITAYSNKLKSIKTAKGNVIKELEISYNSFTNLDLSNYPKLKTLYCRDNKIKTLSFAKNPKIERLYISGNPLTKMTFAKNTSLVSVSADVKTAKLVKNVGVGKEAFISIEVPTDKTYDIKTLVPLVKGYKLSSNSEYITKDGKLHANKMGSFDYASCFAKKGKKSIEVSFWTN